MRCKAPVEFLSDLLHQRNVHLVVEKAVHLQHITRADDTVTDDPFLQKIPGMQLLF